MNPSVPLAEVCTVTMGQAPPGASYNNIGDGYALLAGAGDFGNFAPAPKKHTTLPTRLTRIDDLILCIRATIGDVNWSDKEYCLGRGVAGLRPHQGRLDTRYLWHFVRANKQQLETKGTGSTFKQVSRAHIEEWKIPLPPLKEQKRIAAILDKADAIRRKRQQAIELTDQFLKSVFLKMFGDPAMNPKGWPKIALGHAASIFSDGPFGSNLKSSHYRENGVRVVRLQNIGLNKFLDDDQAYVSESHYVTIRKHTCVPGDVLIGTIGEPNLRACILPERIKVAINKADCIQFRVSENGVPEYFSELLNQPGTLALASHLLHGQTRTRISMGALREIEVPVPPKELQLKYREIVAQVKNLRARLRNAVVSTENLFDSLSQSTFRGELTETQAA